MVVMGRSKIEKLRATVDALAAKKLEIGSEVCVKDSDGAMIYGFIIELEGEEYRGTRPIVMVRTPHGSVIRAGRAFVDLIETEEDHAILAALMKQSLDVTEEDPN